jgi:hypothetical protein
VSGGAGRGEAQCQLLHASCHAVPQPAPPSQPSLPAHPVRPHATQRGEPG